VSDVITDAQLISQFAAKAMEEPEAIIKTQAPSDSEVRLPGGFISKTGEVVRTAEVKELNGLDEEAISKAGSAAKAFNVLLQRGLVKLGSEDVTKDHLDTLLSGDRDAILIGIRRVTFGDTITLNVQCASCGGPQTLEVDLLEDVPTRTLGDPIAERTFKVLTKRGAVTVALPTGVVQKKLVDNTDKTVAEINTILLAGCIMSIDDSPSAGASTALSLGMADRTKILDEIVKRNPGPRLGEVTKACQACGEIMDLPLSLTDLFRL
jgi:hypothetical protein